MGGFFTNSGITSVSLLSMVAVFVSSLVALVPLVAAGNALGLFRFGWQVFGDGFKRLPERKKVWGTIYDSESLRPLSFSVVKLLGSDRRVLERRVADSRGRYGFLTSPASLRDEHIRVSIEVEHDGYRFPSHRDEGIGGLIYGEPYHGESLLVRSDMLVNQDIPMDATRAPHAIQRNKPPSVVAGIATAAMADAGLWVGVFAVPLAFILEPSPFTLGTMFVFAGVASLRLFGVADHPYGTVADTSGRAVPFALITLHNDEGRRVSFAVSDEKGRYFLATRKGGYVLDARTPANIVPPRQAEKSVTARRGWVTEQIIL